MSDDAPTPTQQDALSLLDEHHRFISSSVERLSDEQIVKPGTVGGGDWSVKDLIAHIEAWERLAIETIEDWTTNTYPRIHERYAAAGGVDRLNAELLDERSGWSPQEARSRLASTFDELRAEILKMAESDWNRAPFYQPPVPTKCLGDAVGRVLGSDAGLFAHASDHLADLEAAVEGMS